MNSPKTLKITATTVSVIRHLGLIPTQVQAAFHFLGVLRNSLEN